MVTQATSIGAQLLVPRPATTYPAAKFALNDVSSSIQVVVAVPVVSQNTPPPASNARFPSIATLLVCVLQREGTERQHTHPQDTGTHVRCKVLLRCVRLEA